MTVTYHCKNKACVWDNYKKNEDWGYFSEKDDDCERCRTKCTYDLKCGAVECGHGYCSWWKVGKCRSWSEQNGHVDTCYKSMKPRFRHHSINCSIILGIGCFY